MTWLGASTVMSATWLGVDLAKTNGYRRILTRMQLPSRRMSTLSPRRRHSRPFRRRVIQYDHDVMLTLYCMTTNCRVCQGQIVIKIINVTLITRDHVAHCGILTSWQGTSIYCSFYQAIDISDSQMLRADCLQSVHALATPISPSRIAGQQGINCLIEHTAVVVGPTITSAGTAGVWSRYGISLRINKRNTIITNLRFVSGTS
jgi:hypothetical protein